MCVYLSRVSLYSAALKLCYYWHCVLGIFTLCKRYRVLLFFAALVAIIYNISWCIWISKADRDRHRKEHVQEGKRAHNVYSKCIHFCGVYTQCPLLQRRKKHFKMQSQKHTPNYFFRSLVSLSVCFGSIRI